MLCGRECGPSGRSLARAGWTGHVASGIGGVLDRFLVRGSREVPSIRFARRSAVRWGHWEPFVPKLSRLPLPSVYRAKTMVSPAGSWSSATACRGRFRERPLLRPGR